MTLLRRYGVWLLAAAVAGIAGAWLYHAFQASVYQSTAQVDVEPRVVASSNPIAPNMATEAQIATSGVVLNSTAAALGETPAKMATHLKAGVSGTANVLSIQCTMPTAAAAQHCAATAAASYVAFRDQVTSSGTSQQHDPLDVTLVTPANRPTAPSGLGAGILLAVGAILGLILGFGAIFVRDRFDDRVRDRDDFERCLDAPVLAEIPRQRDPAVDPAFVFERAPLSRAAEAYRYLCTRLQPYTAPAAGGQMVLLVTGVEGGEGRTSAAANLATAMAYAGSRVVLVDADARHPSLGELYGVGERAGLTDLVVGRASRDEVAIPTDVPGLKLVTLGRLPDWPAEMLQVARLGQAFAKLKTIADVVVVDTAPVLAVSDAITMALVSDLVMVVADVRRTSRRAVSAAAQEIRGTGPQTIIGVLNNVRVAGDSQVRLGSTRRPQAPDSSAGVPALLAAAVPPRGSNGHPRVVSAEAGADDGPETPQDLLDAPDQER
jgi:polysaccharide biosynthesis transport protein